MQQEFRKAFNIVELLVTMTITLMVMAGLMFTFTRITRTTKDASKANDMTQEGLGVHQVMTHDFANTGFGINDIAIMEMHYNFNPSFVAQSPGRHFFPIDDLQVTGGFSEITIHRFDYDLVNGNSPTAMGGLDVGDDWPGFGGVYPYINVASNDSNVLANIEQGDIFAIYKTAYLRDSDAYLRDESPWHSVNYIDQLTGQPKNDAMILEAVNVQALVDNGAGGGLQFERRIEFGVGSFFSNNLNPNPMVTPNDRSINDLKSGTQIRGDMLKDGLPTLNPSLTMVRKLGNASTFHRVRYFVQDAGGRNVLIRSDNGVNEILATNVTFFEVKIGIDVPLATPPDQVMNNQMNGYVSVREPSQWIGSFAELGQGDQANQQITGRHAVAVRIKLEFEARQQDLSTNVTQIKTRSFEQVYRLPSTVPFPVY